MRPANVSEKELKARTRRAFLTLGGGAVAGYAGWSWLRSRDTDGDEPWPFTRVLQVNERVGQAYFSDAHLAPVYPASQIGTPKVNGHVGLDGEVDARNWKLTVEGLAASSAQLELAMDDIQRLPRTEHITQFKCIEGWAYTAQWAGARFSDFAARYPPGASRYVSLYTPDEEYYVGLDMQSAMHPQTLLCYELNGKPLTAEHGAPLRLVIPVKYGIKNIKRIGSIAYTNDRPPDYWAEDGYDWYAGL